MPTNPMSASVRAHGSCAAAVGQKACQTCNAHVTNARPTRNRTDLFIVFPAGERVANPGERIPGAGPSEKNAEPGGERLEEAIYLRPGDGDPENAQLVEVH